MAKKEIYLILHNIRSQYNVGSIFRTADAAGVKKIFLTGYTPAPLDKFGRQRKEVGKTALGAEKTVAWEARRNIGSLIKTLKKDGIQILAVEQDKKSISYKKFKPRGDFALILGNEVSGLPKVVLSRCDKILEIPMNGVKESLNVSVSAGIVIFELAS